MSALIVVNLVLSIKYEKGGVALVMPKCIIEHSCNILHAQNLLKKQVIRAVYAKRNLQKSKEKALLFSIMAKNCAERFGYNIFDRKILIGEDLYSISEVYSELGEKNSTNAHSLRF